MAHCDHKFVDSKHCLKCGLLYKQISRDPQPSQSALDVAQGIIDRQNPEGSTLGRIFVINRLKFDIAVAIEDAMVHAVQKRPGWGN